MMNKSIFFVLTLLLAACVGPRGENTGTTQAQYGNFGPAYCYDCGTVTDIRITDRKDGSTGVGAVVGAVVGGFVGSEFGSGSGRDAATVGGAVAGGVAGNAIEKGAGQWYQITVSMDRGGNETIYQRQAPDYGVGARLKVTSGP